jgi:ubiquinone/menaquinone biosynthesis C-methylase UbiE
MRIGTPAACFVALVTVLGFAHPAAAQLGSRSTEEWIKTLEAPARVAGLKLDVVLPRLKLRPGDTVADVGAGAGAFTFAFAKAVAPGGKVYAIEVDQGLLDYIQKKAAEEKVSNVRNVLGKFTDPDLPAKDVDVAFIHDVLHHIEDRAGYVKALATYVKPGGRIVVIDYRPGFGGHKDQPELVTAPEKGDAWLAAAGFKPVEQFQDLNPDKWFTVYARQ